MDEEGEEVKRYISCYRKVIEQFLVPLPLLDYMPDFNNEVRREINNAADNPPKQVKLFLEELERSANGATMRSFLDALNGSEDQKFLYPALSGELKGDEHKRFYDQVEEQTKIARLFEIIKPQLDVLDADLCITTLKPWLNDGESGLLRAKCKTYGNNYTIWWIFDFIIRKDPDWIKEFYRHVKECNYSNSTEGSLAKLLMFYFDFGEEQDPADDQMVCESGQSLDPQYSQAMELSITLHGEAGEADLKSSNNQLRENDLDQPNETSPVSGNTQSPSSADKPPDSNRKPIALHGYQTELAEPAKEGKNVIICAPPGAGKTFVAADIILNYLEKHGNDLKKVLFFTPKGVLARDQKKALEKYLPSDYSVSARYGRGECTSLAEMINTDVIVLTPRILLNEFQSDEKEKAFNQIDDFGLIIFDECHNCFKDDPYNGVMRTYFLLQKNKSFSIRNLPQVVGLTATLGVGRNPKNVLHHMKELCANLDAVDGIVTVCDKDNRKELYENLPDIDKVTIPIVERPPGDSFQSAIHDFYDKVIEQLKQTGDYSNVPSFEEHGSGNPVLRQWCANLKNQIAKTEMPNPREAYSCVEYLELYEKVLDCYNKLPLGHAVEVLEKHFDSLTLDKLEETEKRLFNIAQDVLGRLKPLSDDPELENPNLSEIEKLILKRFETEPNSKGLLMVETKYYATKLTDWANQRESLKFLNAERFMGVTSKSGADDTNFNEKKQQKILNKFRTGESKMLICTAASLGEGVDVPDCNLVINYDLHQNEIAMIQTKGRVRDKAGEMYSVASTKVEEHDKLNAMKEALMERVTKKLQVEISTDKFAFQDELRQIQKASLLKHSADVERKLRKRHAVDGDEYLLHCKKCKTKICSSKDMRLAKGGHHINPTKEFKEKYERKEHKRKNAHEMGKDWVKNYKIHCKQCDFDLGIEATWKDYLSLPLLKANSVKISSETNKRVPYPTPKKWKQAPFKPEEVDLDVIENELDHLNDTDE